MKMTRFTDPQILAILRQAETGVPVPEPCRQRGIAYKEPYRIEPLK